MYKELKKVTEEKEKNYPAITKQLKSVEEMMKLANELAQKMSKEDEKKGEEEDTLDVKPEKKDDDKN
jgi:hypothetical protein